MANYIVSYDLNGTHPTHAAMDTHMGEMGWTRARILETVWYVATRQSLEEVFGHVDSILSENDQLIVVNAEQAFFRNLLVDSDKFVAAWAENT